MKFLCKIGFHKWITLEKEQIVGITEVRVCEKCLRKEYIRKDRTLVRKANKDDKRIINLDKLLNN